MEEPWNQNWHICSLGSNDAACSHPWGCLQTCQTVLADRAGVVPPDSGCKTAAPAIQLRFVSWVTKAVNQISSTLWFVVVHLPPLSPLTLLWVVDLILGQWFVSHPVCLHCVTMGPWSWSRHTDDATLQLKSNSHRTAIQKSIKNQKKRDMLQWRWPGILEEQDKSEMEPSKNLGEICKARTL